MPFTMPRPGDECSSSGLIVLEDQDRGGGHEDVEQRRRISHFQAKPMSWSMRTRGSVPRIHTKTNTKT